MATARLIRFRLCRQGSFESPAAPQSAKDTLPRNTKFSRPLGNRQRVSMKRDESIRSAIVRLLNAARPTAVVRSISTIVVNAFKSRFGRTFAHVGKEGAEIVPPLTDANPTIAVASAKNWCFGITTPIVHRRPNTVGRRVGLPVRVPACLASTGLGVSRYEGRQKNNLFSATFTQADDLPMTLTSWPLPWFDFAQNGEDTKRPTNVCAHLEHGS